MIRKAPPGDLLFGALTTVWQATAAFVPSKDSDTVAEVSKCGSSWLDSIFRVLDPSNKNNFTAVRAEVRVRVLTVLDCLRKTKFTYEVRISVGNFCEK